ncbi:hypothetical protein ACHAQH_010101, partial [Verticillium albo-atrum]
MAESSIVTFPGVPAERVTGAHWNVKPIRNPTVSIWNLGLSMSDVTKLLGGFQPAALEDRWMSCVDGPDDDNGTFVVHFYRSWTSEEQFQIKAKIAASGGMAATGAEYQAEIEEITWDNGLAHSTEEAAKHMA